MVSAAGTVHITWVISHCLAWLLGLELDDYRSPHSYHAACLAEPELEVKVAGGKLRRQETQDSAFSDEPILRDKQRRQLGHQDTLEADFLDHDHTHCPDIAKPK